MLAVRTFAREDEIAVRDLFALCFGKEMSHDEWIWKYMDSPWSSTASLAVDGDSIVAHYGGVGAKFYYQGETFQVFQPCDVMTRPNYRARLFSRRGAMIRAGENFYEGNHMDFAFGFPSERHAILGTKQLGYTKHDYVSILSKRVSRSVHVGNPFLKLDRGWDLISGEEIDCLWNETKDRQGLSIIKNSDYIFWRYKRNPVKRYETLIVRARLRRIPKAFAVFSTNETELSVLDFFCVREFSVRALLRLIEREAERRGLKSISLWANPREEVFRNLTDYGFVRGKGMPYIFRIINKKLDPVFLFGQFNYRMGDYDVS